MGTSTPRETTPPLSELLDRWTAANLITSEQALAIQRQEAGLHEGSDEPPAAETAAPGPSLVAEALGYLGGVIMVVGGGLLVGLSWSHISPGLRLVLAGVTAVALVGAGFALPDRLGAAAGRLRSVLWALAVAATAGFFAIVAADVLDSVDEDALIIVFPPTAAVAAVLWWLRRTWLQQLALFLPVLLAANAVGILLVDPDSSVPGAAMWATAIAWTALAWSGRLEPRVTGVAIGALGAVFGSLSMSSDLGMALGLLTTVAMVALALWERSLPWLGVATLGLLWTGPPAAVEWFPGRLSAAVSLLATGGLLVAAATWVARHQQKPN